MRKTLKGITDAEGYRLKFSSGDLKIPPGFPSDESKISEPKIEGYITCYCFPKSLQNHFYNLKAELFEIIKYTPKII